MTTEIKSAKERIKDYLDERASKDELFAKSYAKTNKNIDECYDYIVGEARKQCKNSDSVCISDDVVYGWAVHYYDEDNIKINKLPANTRVSANASVELTEEDKEKARDLAVKEYKQQCIDKLKAADEAKAKKAAEKRKAEIEKRKQAELQLPNLLQFDEA